MQLNVDIQLIIHDHFDQLWVFELMILLSTSRNLSVIISWFFFQIRLPIVFNIVTVASSLSCLLTHMFGNSKEKILGGGDVAQWVYQLHRRHTAITLICSTAQSRNSVSGLTQKMDVRAQQLKAILNCTEVCGPCHPLSNKSVSRACFFPSVWIIVSHVYISIF